ncbi:carbohydrate ABC transporter permease [Truepera radiovictrix]|uniref:Binding-protein-dependent transport systems inner membrane component n=1 Tax=Truepera radiovictrix (strain DSM 17093 / CIP 108686 / LMG 22925 / RQ-24) TaxID=649638 RepID=D7CU80_TRURR|nr:carbohydrate ABC transporter permease [Truepera radiovictrix]ADI13978.1 binding-protein-dependent transport systems inner membrane component [Truepera radiovictrix DSM 17093]WMT57461.1 carbohydrate ABC transporter permease [Truepera radiovictrix]
MKRPAATLAAHTVLLFYTALALFPVVLVIVNSFKGRLAIFRTPYAPPTPETWDLAGYRTVLGGADFPLYFRNSLVVTLASLALILWVSSMAAFALAEYPFPGNTLLGLYLALGIMVPIRLGTVSLLQMMVRLGLTNTLLALILVYAAAGIPLAVFILTQFMRQVPKDLKDAARIDGASEYRIYALVLPLVRPALGTVAVFNMIPIWNDLWFPLILAPAERTKTVILGAQVFLGQYINDWNAVLAALTLAMVPVIVLYVLFSRQLIRGLTAGSVK